ncbi:MAG: glycosyltransferase family 1 protein, partial [Clostridiales bacterium]|nr:glycosyltransferase family 1 protein [Candidatus Crickella merdequi]
MKICHMTSAHKSDDTRVFQKECKSLASAGHEVYLVAKGESRREGNVEVVGIGDAPASRVRRILHFSKAVYTKA